MTKFQRNSTHKYKVITPDTPLDELEVFLTDNLFAIGESRSFLVLSYLCTNVLLSHHFVVTDYERKFVLAVATRQDLDVCTVS